MLVSTTISWQTTNWPSLTPATQYAIWVNATTGTPAYTVTGSNVTQTVTYDDALAGVTYVIRPTDGVTYGPSQTVVIANQPLNHRAWLRAYVRQSIADRLDTGTATTPKIGDDELNAYTNDALRNYALAFPKEKDTTFALTYQLRTYTLPSDFQRVLQAKYQTQDGKFQLFLKDEPYKGGESTATSYMGYPKLGVLAIPLSGRFYGGHFSVYEGILTLDFDPRGDGDQLFLNYAGQRLFPLTDLDALDVPSQDVEMLALYVQALCWRQIEGKDVALSRWRTKEDGGRRDDLPTEKMSTRMFKAYDTWVQQRRSLRPRNLRLTRRT